MKTDESVDARRQTDQGPGWGSQSKAHAAGRKQTKDGLPYSHKLSCHTAHPWLPPLAHMVISRAVNLRRSSAAHDTRP